MSFSIRTFVILSTCFFNKYFSSDSDDDENCCHQCCDCLKNCLNRKNDENSFSSENSELDNNNNNDIISNSNNDYNNINDYNNNKMMNNFVQNNNNNNNQGSPIAQNQTFNKVQNINPNHNNNQINNNNQPVQANIGFGFNNNVNVNPFPNQNMPAINNFIQNNNQVFPQNQNQQVNKDNFLLFQSPPNIGLNNIGATCFMNSTLQCLSQTKKLTNYFLNPQNKERIIKNNIALKNPNDLQLSPLYLELISKLWATDGSKNYSPYNFMNCIQTMNPLFQKGQAGDAKDFIIFILEQMHSELKKNMKKNVMQLPPLNQYDQKNAMQHFFQDFQEELSIFSDLFFGFNETTNICYDCRNKFSSNGQAYPICYNYGIFNCIIFPLEEVKNMKNNFMLMQNNMGMGFNNNINFNINNNRVNLYDCFIYNQKTDKFTGENQNYCNICRNMADSDYTSRIYVSPNVLILILNRGKNNMFNVKLDFALNIDITNFVILKDRPQVTYNLYGVITHIGESGPNAHFVASCKSPVDNLWYRFNDGLVYPINDFQKEVHDFCNPYILFYQKDE